MCVHAQVLAAGLQGFSVRRGWCCPMLEDEEDVQVPEKIFITTHAAGAEETTVY